jgi:hypothetical protein
VVYLAISILNLGNNRKNCGVIQQMLEDWSGKDWQINHDQV